MVYRYNPHISHLLFPILAVMVSAIVSVLFPAWQTIAAMFAVMLISLGLTYWIVIAGKMKAEEDYWFSIGEAVKELKDAEPEIWEALGFRNPPRVAKLEVEETSKDMGGYTTTKYSDVPVSPALLQTFADGVLSGRKTLSEVQWAGEDKPFGGPTFRKFQDWMLSKEFIIPVNPKAPTRGYLLTELGLDWLRQYASVGVRHNIRVKIAQIDSDGRVRAAPPLEQGISPKT